MIGIINQHGHGALLSECFTLNFSVNINVAVEYFNGFAGQSRYPFDENISRLIYASKSRYFPAARRAELISQAIDQQPVAVQIRQRLQVVICIPAIWTYSPGTCRLKGGIGRKSISTIYADHVAMHAEQGYCHGTAGNSAGHYHALEKPGLYKQKCD